MLVDRLGKGKGKGEGKGKIKVVATLDPTRSFSHNFTIITPLIIE